MATKQNISICQGIDWTFTINVSDSNGDDIDLSSYTANSQMRKSYTSNTYYELLATPGNGYVDLLINNLDSSVIPAGRYVYDVLLTSPEGTKSRLVEGIATVKPTVTSLTHTSSGTLNAVHGENSGTFISILL